MADSSFRKIVTKNNMTFVLQLQKVKRTLKNDIKSLWKVWIETCQNILASKNKVYPNISKQNSYSLLVTGYIDTNFPVLQVISRNYVFVIHTTKWCEWPGKKEFRYMFISKESDNLEIVLENRTWRSDSIVSKQFFEEIFVILGIIKVEVSFISLGR